MFARFSLCAAVAALGLATAARAADTDAPPPFDRGGVKIALVRYLSVGDFYQAYEAGARAQAKALGIDLRIFPGKQDAALEREQVEQAIALGAQAIVIDHGLPESLKDVARNAVEAGIKVVAFDVNLDDPRIPQVEQSDQALAQKALDQIVQENGTSFQAAYVYVAGFAPLDRRDAVWTAFKAAHPGVIEKARFGTVSDTTASAVADQAKAALRANPGITVIFAPYDEFARGAKLAVNELNLADRVKIYSADISTADIGEITEARSPWVATVATNPAVVGAVSIRAAALALTGQGPGPRITVEPVLLTQGALREGGVRTIADLNARIPAFGRSEAASAPWIPQPR